MPVNASVLWEEDDENATGVLALARSRSCRGRLSEYASEHEAAISKAQSEADALAPIGTLLPRASRHSPACRGRLGGKWGLLSTGMTQE